MAKLAELAPTLGPQVAEFISRYGVHGPGDLMGEPFGLSDEELAFLYTAYELKRDRYSAGDDDWKRRWSHAIYCRRKGMRKSELMAQVTLAEFDGPVRFSGVWAEGGEESEWGYVYGAGEPIGQRVIAPEIPVVATTEQQAEKLVWGVIRYVFENTPLSARFKVQNDQIFFAGKSKEEGWIFPVPPTNSKAADGAKPSFIPREEAHLWTTGPLRETAEVMDRNKIKRKRADAWTMDASTTYAPGEDSVLESAVQSIKGGAKHIYYDYLAARASWDLKIEEEWLEAVREASGDAYEWTNIEGMRTLWLDPKVSTASFRRYQLNQPTAVEQKPFDGDSWDRFESKDREPPLGAPIVLFLDGALTRDSTALIAWTVEDRPHLWLPGIWQRTDATLREEWSVDKREVSERIAELMADYNVITLAADSDRYWSPEIRAWQDTYTDDVVVNFPTRAGRLMSTAIDRWAEDWRAGLAKSATGDPLVWTHAPSPILRKHFASTVVHKRGTSKVLAKESESLEHKIDAAVAAISGYALIADARTKVDSKVKVSPWAG